MTQSIPPAASIWEQGHRKPLAGRRLRLNVSGAPNLTGRPNRPKAKEMECQVSLSTNQPPSSKPPGCQHDLFRPVRLPGDRPSPSWLAERFLEERAPRLAVADPPEDDDAAAAGRSKLAIAVPTSTRIRRSPYLGSAIKVGKLELESGTEAGTEAVTARIWVPDTYSAHHSTFDDVEGSQPRSLRVSNKFLRDAS
ncbi:hypothetical protein CSUB01_02456 [Colletotrichum sublineola]|uniref:Uncharacterized protein n=1 Tax=Colletotrichum sublineola TaxID=1173701 RepID=A0A066WZY1_COLSU|nr:hypothetical protein CSUB01_02456 [Colletotrichum sublineola]